MDKLSDVWDNLKERLSNPLIFSFLLSWLVFNWRVVVGLLWYDAKEIQSQGYASYFQLIESNVYHPTGFLYPALVAIGYVIFSPVLKHIFRWFHVLLQKVFDRPIMELAGQTPINYDMYHKKLQEIEQTKNELAVAVNQDAEMRATLAALRADLEKTKNQHQQTIEEKDKKYNMLKNLLDVQKTAAEAANTILERQQDYSVLDGIWIIVYDPHDQPSQHIKISEGTCYSLLGQELFKIKNYFHERIENTDHVFFVALFPKKETHIYTLTYQNQIFEGLEDYKTPVRFIKEHSLERSIADLNSTTALS